MLKSLIVNNNFRIKYWNALINLSSIVNPNDFFFHIVNQKENSCLLTLIKICNPDIDNIGFVFK